MIDKLPQFCIQLVCQILVDSGYFRCLLSLRSTCSDLYSLINSSTILLSKNIRSSTFSQSSLQFISENTKWKYRKLCFLEEFPEDISTKWLTAFSQHRETFVDKLSYLHVDLQDNDCYISFLNSALRLLYRPGTTVHLKVHEFAAALNCMDNFRYHDIVDSLEFVMGSDCHPGPNADQMQKFKYIKSMVIYDVFSNMRANTRFLTQSKALIHFPSLEFLRELKTVDLDFILSALPRSALPFFPSVQKLEFFRWNVSLFPDVITRHFPNLKVFRCTSHLSLYRRTAFTERENVSSCFPDTLRTLHLNASMLEFCLSLRNVKELHVLFEYNTQVDHPRLLENLRELVIHSTLTVLVMTFEFETAISSVTDNTEVLEFCAEVLRAQPHLKVMALRDIYHYTKPRTYYDSETVHIWKEVNKDLLDRCDLKLFIFGERVQELKDLGYEWMMQMEYLNDELLRTVKEYIRAANFKLTYY